MKSPLTIRAAVEAHILNQSCPANALSTEQRDQQAELRARHQPAGSGLIVPFFAGPAERRDMSVTGGTTDQYGGELVGTDVPEAGPSLYQALRLPALGARTLIGLRGNADLPYGSTAITAEWLSENEAGNDLTPVLGVLSMRPKRVAAHVPVSLQLIAQGGEVFAAWIRDELMTNLGAEIERVAIAGAGTGGEPTGIINTNNIGSVAGGTNGAAPDLADLCYLEFAVTGTGKADRGPLGWILSPKARKKLRQTASNGTGSAMLWPVTESDRLLGHPAGVTTASPDNLTKGSSSEVCSAITFGNFSELFVALWGAGIEIDVTRDRAMTIAGQVLVTARAYVDCGVRNPKAFAVMKDALCA